MLDLRGKSDSGDKINTHVIAPLVDATALLKVAAESGKHITLEGQGPRPRAYADARASRPRDGTE